MGNRGLTIILAAVGVALAVAFVPRLLPDGGDPHPPEPSHPETIPAAYTLAFLRESEVGAVSSACSRVTDELAKRFRCGTAQPRVPTCGRFRALPLLINRYDDFEAQVQAGTCTIDLVFAVEEWVVSEVARR